MWTLDFDLGKAPLEISHSSRMFFIGSCFAETIFSKTQTAGFNSYQPKLGSLFHPTAIFKVLENALQVDPDLRVFKKENHFLSWDTASVVNAFSEKEVQQRLKTVYSEVKTELQNTDVLFITLGTAKGYYFENEFVANCHKVPSVNFTNQLIDDQAILIEFKRVLDSIRLINPNLKVVLTVSPVRHVRDGLIENNRSKARLLKFVELAEKLEGVSYFPAYEILIDKLRDYRFYAEDMVHPNEIAQNYIWSVFKSFYCSTKTNEIIKKLKGFDLFFNHKSILEEDEFSQFKKQEMENSFKNFLKEHPEVSRNKKRLTN
ncbi:MAG: lysophospholipase L1-like esterase [Lentimonas sp.]|jgi:lysophospholipase L1-like esterase